MGRNTNMRIYDPGATVKVNFVDKMQFKRYMNTTILIQVFLNGILLKL